jgi:hypothetical protein
MTAFGGHYSRISARGKEIERALTVFHFELLALLGQRFRLIKLNFILIHLSLHCWKISDSIYMNV